MRILTIICVAATAVFAADQSPEFYQRRGQEHFKHGRIAESIADFDQFLKLAPEAAPHHWQRGISLYYAGRYQEGRGQFESHKSVNPHDVENAAWHYLCAAREQNPAAARKAIIPIDTARDRRIPMKQIYDLYAGKGTVEEIMTAANEAPEARRESARFYAHLYLGLYYEVNSKPAEARKHMELAATKHAQDHYMGDVAKVHWAMLQKK